MAASERAGRYEEQPSGYRAFIPASLPPNPAIEVDSEMQTLLSRADRALGRLDGSISTLPEQNLFVLMYARKEAVLSSQIEGTQSSLTDLLKAEAKIFDPERPEDVKEVSNYVRAMHHGLQRLDHRPVSLQLIQEIHERLLTGVRGAQLNPGEIRDTQNWIGPAGSDMAAATFVPPPPTHLTNALTDLERFIHADDPMPPLLRIGIAHAQFETIHPFLDGNGRVGRLLITLMLCEQDILQGPVLYLSHYLRRYRAEYYEHLQAVRETGAWEKWLKFFVRGVGEVSNEAAETARHIVGLREAHREVIVDSFGRVTDKALRILENLFQLPLISVGSIAELTDVSFSAANKLTAKLVEFGILEEATGHARNRVFRYGDYIDLFSKF